MVATIVMTVNIGAKLRTICISLISLTLLFTPVIPSLFLIFAILLPTIIHVYVFTGGFILHGALKNNSTSGGVSFTAFILVPTILVLLSLYDIATPVSSYVQDAYQFMLPVNQTLLSLLHLGGNDLPQTIFYSTAGIALMKFIAFAYTYHYLNWFSKTKVIKWHLVSAPTLTVTLLLWIGSVALYLYDYKLGLLVLGTLSILHVILEFPLNHRTLYGIGFELKKIYSESFLVRS